LVEQGTENPCVTGSIPVRGTTKKTEISAFFYFTLQIRARDFQSLALLFKKIEKNCKKGSAFCRLMI